MNILDIVIALFFAFQLYMGYSKGAIESLFDLLGYAFAAVVTYLFYVPARELLVNATPIGDAITSFVSERLRDLGASSMQSTVSTNDLNAMQELPIPEAIKARISEFLTGTVAQTTQNVSGEISDFLITLIAIVTLFIVVLIAVKLIASMMNVIAKLPVISTFNTLGGVAFGFIKAYIVVSLLFLIAITVFSINDYPAMQQTLETSLLARYFINYNLFLIVLQYIPQ